MKTDLIIIGAGPVGMATAIAAKELGMRVALYDRDDREGTHSYALALHPWTVQQLSDWDLKAELGPESRSLNRMDFYSLKGLETSVDFTQIHGFEDGLLVVGQDHLERALLKGCAARDIPVHWNHRLAQLKIHPDEVELQLESLIEAMSGYAMARMELQVDTVKTVMAPLVVGADGHLSAVRRRLGIGFPEVGPKSCFAVFEFQTDAVLEDAVSVTLCDGGTSVLWPLPGGYCRWSFEIDEEAADAITRDKDRMFAKVGSDGYHTLERSVLDSFLEARAPWFTGSVENFRWRMLVRFERRLTESYGTSRCWLAGDAAHLAPPVGMQSMNIGMREGVDLAGRMNQVLRGHSDLNRLALYNHSRLMEWQALLGISQVFVPGVESPEGSWIADQAARLQLSVPATADTFEGFAKALGLTIAIR